MAAVPDRPASAALVARLKASGLTVAVAESASGGLIAAELTRAPGSSSFFKGGIVAYDDASKTRILGIAREILAAHGAVSAEACLAMAQAARRLFGSDIGIGETAISGPGGATATKPVGLSFVAISGPRGDLVNTNRFAGKRDANRRFAAAAAVQLLASYLPPG